MKGRTAEGLSRSIAWWEDKKEYSLNVEVLTGQVTPEMGNYDISGQCQIMGQVWLGLVTRRDVYVHFIYIILAEAAESEDKLSVPPYLAVRNYLEAKYMWDESKKVVWNKSEEKGRGFSEERNFRKAI